MSIKEFEQGIDRITMYLISFTMFLIVLEAYVR